jgi:hypothetical protein
MFKHLNSQHHFYIHIHIVMLEINFIIIKYNYINRKYADTKGKRFGIQSAAYVNVSDCSIKIDFSLKYL